MKQKNFQDFQGPVETM